MRALALLIAALLLTVVSSALCRLIGLAAFPPEMPLLVALYAGFSVGNQRIEATRPSWTETAIIGLGAGYLGDLLAGAPVGLGALACIGVALVARSFADRLLLTKFWRTALVVWFFSVGHGSLLMLGMAALGGVRFYRQLPLVLAISVATGLLAPLVFRLFDVLLRPLQRGNSDGVLLRSELR